MDNKGEFDRLAGLLPSYVNGTIADAERQELEGALRQSIRLQEELKRERALAQGVKDVIAPQISAAQECQEDRLADLVDRLPSEKPVSLLGTALPDAPERNPLSFLNPARWRPAVALSLALAGLGGFSMKQASEIAELQAENFRLASGQCEEVATGGIVVELAADTKWDELVALLEKEGLAITASGAFGTLVLTGGDEDETAAARAERLRAEPIIASAEPAA